MKPAPFEYIRPKSLEEACALIAQDSDAVLIAGGQTLVPMMAMRLARPACLVDIARLPGLAGIRLEGDRVVIGATTRQVEAERSALVRRSSGRSMSPTFSTFQNDPLDVVRTPGGV